MELFSLGDATNDAVSTTRLYRLNCRPVSQPARRVTVQMQAQVPATMRSGRRLTVTWKLYLPHFAQRGDRVAILTARIT